MHLMTRLRHALPGVMVQGTEVRGLPPLQVEAAAFAWLARQTLQREPGSLAASRARVAPVCWVRFTQPETGHSALRSKNWSHNRRWWWRWGF
jgi:1,6-anhydro-N-acetylmuramate kinase